MRVMLISQHGDGAVVCAERDGVPRSRRHGRSCRHGGQSTGQEETQERQKSRPRQSQTRGRNGRRQNISNFVISCIIYIKCEREMYQIA